MIEQIARALSIELSAAKMRLYHAQQQLAAAYHSGSGGPKGDVKRPVAFWRP